MQNGGRYKNFKTYFLHVPWADKSTTSECLIDKAFTLLSSFTRQFEKYLLHYLGETIKLGCAAIAKNTTFVVWN